MKRFTPILYTLATILLIVGALFIFQGENYGLFILGTGLGLNILYRLLSLDYAAVRNGKWREIFRIAAVLILIVACVALFVDSEQKFNLLIVSIVLDLAVNANEISLKPK